MPTKSSKRTDKWLMLVLGAADERKPGSIAPRPAAHVSSHTGLVVQFLVENRESQLRLLVVQVYSLLVSV